MAPEPRVWALVDHRTGSANQALGVAEALGLPFETRRLDYNRLAALPNAVLGRSLVHLTRASAARLAAPWPDIVVAAGRRTAPVARAVRKRSGGRCFLAQIMWPGPPAGGFDLIAAPAHDRRPAGPAVIATVGAPHRVTGAALARAREAWAGRLGGLAAPRVAVLVGGPAPRNRFTPDMARELCRRAAGLAERSGGTLMVATSRRTGAAIGEALRASLPSGAQVCRPGDADDPYLGYLGWSDAVIVTGDSASMCTEACATGRPVHIFAPDGMAPARLRRLHRRLYDHGAARPLDATGDAAGLPTWRYRPLDDAATVAAEILRRAGRPGTG